MPPPRPARPGRPARPPIITVHLGEEALQQLDLCIHWTLSVSPSTRAVTRSAGVRLAVAAWMRQILADNLTNPDLPPS